MLNRLMKIKKGYLANFEDLPNVCWSAIILIFIQSCVIGVCFFLSIYFVNDLNLSVSISGLIMSCYGAGTIIGGIINGVLSDKYSPKLISTFNLIIETISIFMLEKIKNPFFLMIDLFILGIVSFD